MTEGVVLEKVESPREELLKVLSKENNGEKGSKIKPRLTFLFPISERRKKAVEGIKSGEVDKENLTELLMSGDFVERSTGFTLLKKAKFNEDDVDIFLPFFISLLENSEIDVFYKKDIIGTIGQLGGKALPVLEKIAIDKDYVKDKVGIPDMVSVVADAILSMGIMGEQALPILKKLSISFSWETRREVARALGYVGKDAIPTLKELLQEKKYRSINENAITSLGMINGDEAFSILENLKEEKDNDLRATVAFTFGQFGERGLEMLRYFGKDSSSFVRESVAEACELMGEDSISIIKELIEDPNKQVRKKAIKSCGKIGESTCDLLVSMEKVETESDVRLILATNLGKTGEKGILTLKSMLGRETFPVLGEVIKSIAEIEGDEAFNVLSDFCDSDISSPTLGDAIRAISKFGKRAFPVLIKFSKHPDYQIREAAADCLWVGGGEAFIPLIEMGREKEIWSTVIFSLQKLYDIEQIEKGGNKDLLSTKKPLFATSESSFLIDRIRKLEEIALQIKDKFGDEFVGLVALGSTSKGFPRSSSDFDWAVIGKNKKVADYFRVIAEEKGLELCREHYCNIDNKGKLKGTKDSLFSGLFFGDYEELARLQLRCLQSITDEKWDKMRRFILKNETNLKKAKERFGLSDEEERKIKETAALLRVPPTREEAIKILTRRVKSFKRKKV